MLLGDFFSFLLSSLFLLLALLEGLEVDDLELSDLRERALFLLSDFLDLLLLARLGSLSLLALLLCLAPPSDDCALPLAELGLALLAEAPLCT